jgi:hypothetical protein
MRQLPEPCGSGEVLRFRRSETQRSIHSTGRWTTRAFGQRMRQRGQATGRPHRQVGVTHPMSASTGRRRRVKYEPLSTGYHRLSGQSCHSGTQTAGPRRRCVSCCRSRTRTSGCCCTAVDRACGGPRGRAALRLTRGSFTARLLIGERQLDDKSGAAFVAVLGADPPGVGAHDAATDGQSQTRATHSRASG